MLPLIVAFLLWLLVGVAAISVRMLAGFSVSELERYCLQHGKKELFGEVMEGHDKVLIAPLTVGLLSLIGLGAVWVGWIPQMHPAATLALVAFGLLAAVVWIPIAVTRYWSAPIVFHTWRAWVALHHLLWPLHIVGRMVEGLAQRLSGRTDAPADEEEAFEEDIMSMVTAGLHDGLLEPDAREMIEGVIELDDVDVNDIMTPRSQIETLSVEATWPEVLKFVTSAGRTRIPVYQGQLDNIVGVLYAKDLLAELSNEPDERQSIRELAREPVFVPPTKRVDDLLRDFRRLRNHLAIVRDEFMTVTGVVTIEDALEEIVGEIVDEFDADEEKPFVTLDDHTLEAYGWAHITEINEELGLALPEPDDVDTIGGLVVHQLRRIPRVGEACRADHALIIVLRANRRRVERVRVERTTEAARGRSEAV